MGISCLDASDMLPAYYDRLLQDSLRPYLMPGGIIGGQALPAVGNPARYCGDCGRNNAEFSEATDSVCRACRVSAL